MRLGEGRDVLELSILFLPERPKLVVEDFATGTGGDAIDIAAYLAAYLVGWDGEDPFATGHLRLVQSGSDAVLKVDYDAWADDWGWETLMLFESVQASSFTAENLGGFAPPMADVQSDAIAATKTADLLIF